MNRNEEPKLAAKESETLSVKGQIHQSDNRPLIDRVVRAFDKDMTQ
jgi:hypothetical protein